MAKVRRAHNPQISQAEAAEAKALAYKNTFASPAGQEVLADLIAFCGVMAASPNDETEGARKVGLYIIHQLTRDTARIQAFALNKDTEALFQ